MFCLAAIVQCTPPKRKGTHTRAFASRHQRAFTDTRDSFLASWLANLSTEAVSSYLSGHLYWKSRIPILPFNFNAVHFHTQFVGSLHIVESSIIMTWISKYFEPFQFSWSGTSPLHKSVQNIACSTLLDWILIPAIVTGIWKILPLLLKVLKLNFDSSTSCWIWN